MTDGQTHVDLSLAADDSHPVASVDRIVKISSFIFQKCAFYFAEMCV